MNYDSHSENISEILYFDMVWELILSTKQSLQSDTFLYVVGTIIANVEFLHGRKVVTLFVIL